MILVTNLSVHYFHENYKAYFGHICRTIVRDSEYQYNILYLYIHYIDILIIMIY